MARKITKEEFLQRFYRNYPDAKIELINYTAISNPLDIQCKKCNKNYHYSKARNALKIFNCCIEEKKNIDRLIELYNSNEDFDFVKQIDKDYFIVRHNICGNEIKRVIQNSLDNPFTCKYCNDIKKNNMLSIEEVQKQVDSKFFNTISVLDYNGQLEINHYKCLKCGLIFTQRHICLLESRGCPKCDRFKSMGEKQISTLLKEHNINFKEQVKVNELSLQRFDFGIYDNDNNLLYFIEVQGEQHREKREIFKDSLEKIQERDNRKREYCKNNNIPLYEIIYQKGKIKNLDILPF